MRSRKGLNPTGTGGAGAKNKENHGKYEHNYTDIGFQNFCEHWTLLMKDM